MRRVGMGGVAVLSILASSSPRAKAADLQHGQKVFQACRSCHTLETDGKGFGPTLNGIVGRPAAAVASYSYSPAMRKAAADGLVWDEKALAEFLVKPQGKVPGTTMRFWGLWQRELDDVIAYLKTAGAKR